MQNKCKLYLVYCCQLSEFRAMEQSLSHRFDKIMRLLLCIVIYTREDSVIYYHPYVVSAKDICSFNGIDHMFLVSANYDLATSYILGRLENNDYGLAIVYASVLIVTMLLTILVIQLLVGKRKLGRRDQNDTFLHGNMG